MIDQPGASLPTMASNGHTEAEPSAPVPPRWAGFQQKWEEFLIAESAFEDALVDAVEGEFERLGHDPYDVSLEFHQCDPIMRLNEAGQRLCFDAGFRKVYVNHTDGWETHYSFSGEFHVQRGWRRKDDGKGGWLISWLPAGWRDDLASRCTIIPDPLETPTPESALDGAEATDRAGVSVEVPGMPSQ